MQTRKLERFINQLTEFKVSSKKRKSGTWAIYFKKVKLFEGIEEIQADYILSEISGMIKRITEKYQKYLIEQIAKVQQLEIETFGIPQQMEILNESNTSSSDLSADK